MSHQFTEEEINVLRQRRENKRRNAVGRGVEFNLNMDDMRMLGAKLLGHGCCDYTGLPFSTRIANNENGHDPKYPTIERIDDKMGYVRGNVCVVMQRANQLKDRLVDKLTSITIQDPFDRELVRAMMLNLSQDRMEKLKKKYIPTQENKMDTNVEEMDSEEILDREASQHMKSIGQEGDTSVHYKNPLPETATATLPEDVTVALTYANYCNSFANAGMNVSVTYAQFKAKYTRKVCTLTGEKLSEEPKSVLILDLDIGFAKDNFIIVSKTMEKALTQLMITTKMSLPKVTAMLSKVV